MIATSQWRTLFRAFAKQYDFPAWPQQYGFVFDPAVWFEALALHESSGNPQARHSDVPAGQTDNGVFEDRASYGLCQIEGSTYRALYGIVGHYDFAAQLYLPGHCIYTAVRVLLPLIAQYTNVARALAAYNGGTWGAGINDVGVFNDNEYVELVRASARLVQADCAKEA